MSPVDALPRLDALVAHVWMVRAFIKHSEEAEEDGELREVQRALYDFALSLGPAWKDQDAPRYLKQARKKLPKLREASTLFMEIQPDVSTHMNFQMAARSLELAVRDIEATLADVE